MISFTFRVAVVTTLAFSVLSQQPVPLHVQFYGQTAGGFRSAPRGWNSFALQANPAVAPSFTFNQSEVLRHCRLLRPIAGHDTYCSLDSGWSEGGNGDEYGRLIPADNFPNITALADELHAMGLKLGVYVLPGAFNNDEHKTVIGTNITLGSIYNRTEDPSGNTCNNFYARWNFNWHMDGVRQWHESVIELFASWGVDFIKLDFVTPGSPDGGCLPYDNSQSAKFYREAIDKVGRPMRIDLSWKLDRRDPYWDLWRDNADTLRTDQDINNAGQQVLVSWEVTQRAINHYRLFIVDQVSNASRHGTPIKIRPDMDNNVIGNPEWMGGLTDFQRYTQAVTWIGAGATLITGSDMKRLDTLGVQLLWNEELMQVAEFCAEYPMQPRNPEGSSQVGGYDSVQYQTWIAGPNGEGAAVVIMSNYGPDLGQGGFGTGWRGEADVSISLEGLGIGEGMPEGGRVWEVSRLWGVGYGGGMPFNITVNGRLEARLDEGESALFLFKRVE